MRHSTKKSYCKVTAYKPYSVTNYRFQLLDNLQENDCPADVLSKISHHGKDYCSAVKVRSAHVKGDHQIVNDIGKTHFHNSNFNNPDTKNNLTIPVIVKGQALTSKSNPVNRQSSKFFHKNDHKVLIIGDSHTRLCAINIKSEIKVNYNVQGLVKLGAGAGAGILVNTANSDITNLTKNYVVSANNIAKNNSKTALKHCKNFVKSNNHTNIILVNVPHRFDLMQSSCVNNGIRSINRKRMNSVRAYQHASFLEMSSDRNLFTNHVLHLNDLRKEVQSKQIVCHTYAMLDEKKNPPSNLKLELRYKLHRYTTSGKSYKQNIHQNKEDPINEIR